MENLENAVTFSELNWDTDFFGVTCAKATLNKPLTLSEWIELKSKFKGYQFISIMNKNSEPINAQLIGKDTTAFLADVNIQFEKKLVALDDKPENITIHKALEKNDEIIDIADFQYSKFIEDPDLAMRGGGKVYKKWLTNAFERPDKFFALSKNVNEKINGFLLFSYADNACVIELIAVSKKEPQGGIGSALFKAVEYEATQKGFNNIQVGTQVRNLVAINFYQKVGCKQVECHQVYHLWNL